MAIAKIFGVNIEIWEPDGIRGARTRAPYHACEGSIKLAYVNNNHYDAIILAEVGAINDET